MYLLLSCDYVVYQYSGLWTPCRTVVRVRRGRAYLCLFCLWFTLLFHASFTVVWEEDVNWCSPCHMLYHYRYDCQKNKSQYDRYNWLIFCQQCIHTLFQLQMQTEYNRQYSEKRMWTDAVPVTCCIITGMIVKKINHNTIATIDLFFVYNVYMFCYILSAFGAERDSILRRGCELMQFLSHVVSLQ